MFEWLDLALYGGEVADFDDPQLRFAFSAERSIERRREEQSSMLVFSELCELVSERAVERCDIAARRAALSLSADARFFAYAAHLADPTRRVREMIATCPGLFTLGAMCDPDGERARALMVGIQTERPLDELAELMLPVVFGQRADERQLRAGAEILRWSPVMDRDRLCAALADTQRSRPLSRRRLDHSPAPGSPSAAAPSRRRVLFDERIRGPLDSRANLTISDDGRTLFIEAQVAPRRTRRSFCVELALRAPVGCTVNGMACGVGVHAHAGWDLESGDSRHGGPFKDVFWWISSELWDPDVVFCHSPSGLALAALGPTDGHRHDELEKILEWAAQRAVELCDPDARAVARRYPRETRFFVYAALVDDPTGRVRQMLDVCPNLLTLTAACNRDADVILEAIRAGEKLGGILDLAVRSATRQYGRGGGEALNPSAAALVRRIPPLPLDDLLDLLHAPGVDINDLPGRDPLGAWAALMTIWSRAARGIPDHEAALRLGGFYSKHGLTADALFEVEAVEAILDWLHYTGSAVPTRRSSPHRVKQAIERWHATLHDDVVYPPETPLAAAPMPVHPIAAIEVTPIATVGALIAEGQAMHHCVAMSAPTAVAGQHYIYSATIEGARITLAVTGTPGCWRLAQAAGVANRCLNVYEQNIVERWLNALPTRANEVTR
jgi:hypothetical protein